MNQPLIPQNDLSVTLSPLVSANGGEVGGVRSALRSIAGAGYRFVQLSGALSGLRPRELGRSARRDLRALLNRMELAPSGIDLWIPMEHFKDGQQCQRAVDALLEVIELARDLGGIAVSTALPGASEQGEQNKIRDAIADRADACSILIADFGHSWNNKNTDNSQNKNTELSNDDGPALAVEMIGCGIDPAMEIVRGGDPATQVLQMGKLLTGVRFSDSDGAGRVEPGLGKLDILSFQIALVTAGYNGQVIVDGRGLSNAESAMKHARSRWGITQHNQ